MIGNQSPYDPTEMFKEWIGKSGKAQAEFIKNFVAFMGSQPAQQFDPLKALKEMSDKAIEVFIFLPFPTITNDW